MKKSLAFLLLFYGLNSFAQFAIVRDRDGMLNVRANGRPNGKVLDQLPAGHLMYCFETKGNRTSIMYKKNGKERYGYVYKDRYQIVSGFPKFTVSEKTATSVTLRHNGVLVSLTQSKFEKAKHRFTYVKDYPDQIQRIDNQQYWGMDGGMPTTQFESIVIKAGQKTITLPRYALQGLFQPNMYSAQVNYDKVNDTFYIQTMNSDGAGAYAVIWKVEKGVYKERLVAYGF